MPYIPKLQQGLMLRAILVATLASSLLFGSVSLALANNTHSADTDNDGFISVAEGVPFYGGIVHSLTTTGDVSADSALALDRFPVADEDGEFEYERTFTISDEIDDLTEAHIVVHGIDINNNGSYDGDKESSIADGVPFEATVPTACGEIEREDDGEYKVDLRQLNSTGAYGEAEITLDGDQLTIELEMEDVSPNLPHAQHIHLGGDNVCPPNTEGVDDDDDDKNDTPRDRFKERRTMLIERQIDRLERFIDRIESRIDSLQDRLGDLY